ncbi:hypothetical protein CRENBAI_009529 [Crenichthys baileyi]|uniref:Uncharacterized protein n=1 Tax=Crenichthys baileyi TaxID=28760 RepID=A0AAV9RSG6_9TELE
MQVSYIYSVAHLCFSKKQQKILSFPVKALKIFPQQVLLFLTTAFLRVVLFRNTSAECFHTPPPALSNRLSSATTLQEEQRAVCSVLCQGSEHSHRRPRCKED